MNEKKLYFTVFIVAVIIGFTLAALLSGCETRSPVVVDTGDIERLRQDYRQLMDEYNKLKSDYAEFIEENQFYADYYRNTTAAIESGIDELIAIGNSQLTEIAKLRANITVIRKIINSIIEGQQKEGRENPQADGNE
jgi:transposase